MGLYAANSIFVGDYLTTRGQIPEADYKMIKEMRFEVTRVDQPIASQSMDGSSRCENAETHLSLIHISEPTRPY